MQVRRHDSGFSLVEVIIAMGITGTALFGLVSVIAFSTRSNMATRENATALRLAEKQIEAMRATPFKTILSVHLAASDFAPVGKGVNKKAGDLEPQAGKDFIGKVKFPVDGSNRLLESLTGALLANGGATPVNISLDDDGAVDLGTTDKSGDYKILPVSIEISWKGVLGNRQMVFRHIFLEK